MTDQITPPAPTPAIYNEWRGLLSDCAIGKSHLRVSDYNDLIGELDELRRLRALAAATPAPAPDAAQTSAMIAAFEADQQACWDDSSALNQQARALWTRAWRAATAPAPAVPLLLPMEGTDFGDGTAYVDDLGDVWDLQSVEAIVADRDAEWAKLLASVTHPVAPVATDAKQPAVGFSGMWLAPLDGTPVLLHMPTTRDKFAVGRWTDAHGGGWTDDDGQYYTHTPTGFLGLHVLEKIAAPQAPQQSEEKVCARCGGIVCDPVIPQDASSGMTDAKDAARYRWLRDRNDWYAEPRLDEKDGTKWELVFYSPQRITDPSDDDNLDAAVDAAIAGDSDTQVTGVDHG